MAQNFCPNCGGELQYQDAEICPKCGVRIKEPPKPVQEKYAGFWIRLGAHIIDGIILAVVIYASLFIVILMGAALTPNNYYSSYPSSNYAASGILFILWIVFAIGFLWLYYAYQESSPSQATIGKRAMNLRVTDLEENRISFGKATVRTIVKFIPIIGPIGCLIIGFSDNKQGLHDIVAGTRILING